MYGARDRSIARGHRSILLGKVRIDEKYDLPVKASPKDRERFRRDVRGVAHGASVLREGELERYVALQP